MPKSVLKCTNIRLPAGYTVSVTYRSLPDGRVAYTLTLSDIDYVGTFDTLPDAEVAVRRLLNLPPTKPEAKKSARRR